MLDENCTALGLAYHKTSQYKKEKKLYRKADRFFPDDIHLTGRQIILALTEGDTVSANKYIKKYISISRNNLSSGSAVSADLAQYYSESGLTINQKNTIVRHSHLNLITRTGSIILHISLSIRTEILMKG